MDRTYTRKKYTIHSVYPWRGHTRGGDIKTKGIQLTHGEVHRKIPIPGETYTWMNIHTEGNTHEGPYTRKDIHIEEHTHGGK